VTWTKTRLKYLCVDSGQYGLNISADQYDSVGARLIRTSDIDDSGQLKPDLEGVFVDVPLEDRHVLETGDLLLSRSGTLGRSFLVPQISGRSTFAGFLVRFRPRSTVNPRFLAYVAKSTPFQDTIRSEAVSSTIQNFNAERYANIALDVPCMEEQCRIADFLDAETDRIDQMLSARGRQRELLHEDTYAEVTEALLPGSLTTPLNLWPWMWLPKIHHDRPLVRLGYVCRLQNGLTVDGARDVTGDVVTRPYLRVANVQAGYISLEEIKYITLPRSLAYRSMLRRGDVLMTEGGDLDKLGRGTVWHGELSNCLHQNHVFAIRPNRSKLDGDYLALMTQTVHGRCYFESTGVKTTNLASTNSSKILSFPIPLPSVTRQQLLVRQVAGRLDAIGRARAALDAQSALLAERRQALITAAVTGQIDVTTARGVDVA
jgi:type I restriction enzyme, S subunit